MEEIVGKLPEVLEGERFLEQCGDHGDDVTVVKAGEVGWAEQWLLGGLYAVMCRRMCYVLCRNMYHDYYVNVPHNMS